MSERGSIEQEIARQIADLSGIGGDDAYNLKSALEALLNAPSASAAQLMAAATPLLTQASRIQATGSNSQFTNIAYTLSEEALAVERQRLNDIAGNLFDPNFQGDLRNAFAQGGDDLVQAYDKTTEETVEELERIDEAMQQPGITTAEKQALLEEKQAVLRAYTGELDALLQIAEERGVDGIGPLAQRVREQQEALDASALSPQQREAKVSEAGREAAAVAAGFAGIQSDAMSVANDMETETLIAQPKGQLNYAIAQTVTTNVIESADIADDPFSFSPMAASSNEKHDQETQIT